MSAVEKLASGAVPDYRPLRRGEPIRPGDEVWFIPRYRGRYLRAHATWEPYTGITRVPYRGGPVRMRRPIAPVTGRDLCE